MTNMAFFVGILTAVISDLSPYPFMVKVAQKSKIGSLRLLNVNSDFKMNSTHPWNMQSLSNKCISKKVYLTVLWQHSFLRLCPKYKTVLSKYWKPAYSIKKISPASKFLANLSSRTDAIWFLSLLIHIKKAMFKYHKKFGVNEKSAFTITIKNNATIAKVSSIGKNIYNRQ